MYTANHVWKDLNRANFKMSAKMCEYEFATVSMYIKIITSYMFVSD